LFPWKIKGFHQLARERNDRKIGSKRLAKSKDFAHEFACHVRHQIQQQAYDDRQQRALVGEKGKGDPSHAPRALFSFFFSLRIKAVLEPRNYRALLVRLVAILRLKAWCYVVASSI